MKKTVVVILIILLLSTVAYAERRATAAGSIAPVIVARNKTKVRKTTQAVQAIKARIIPQQIKEKAHQKIASITLNYTATKKAFSESRQQFLDAKARSDERAITHAKNYLQRIADLVIKSLEKLKSHVEASENLSDEEVQEILDEIDEKIQEMQDAKQEVEDAETKQEVKKAGRVILSAWKHTRPRLKRLVTKLIHAKMGEIIQRSKHLRYKLRCSLQNAESAEIQDLVNQFNDLVDSAEQNFLEARRHLIEAKLEEGQGKTEATEEAKQKINQAHRQLKQAHEILKQIVRLMREQGIPIRDCECDECDLHCELVDEEEGGCQVCECAPECEEPSDCEGDHEDCEGEWTCEDGECEWECVDTSCVEVADCEDLTHEDCDGEWTCDDNECEWECIDTSCEAAEDCEDLTHEDCDGEWLCLDNQCTWQCAFCGISTNGACETDDNCTVGGCSSQVCHNSTEEPVSICDMKDCYDPVPYDLSCKCVDNQCGWA